MTGTFVSERYENLPTSVAIAVKVCLYRVVQEGLTNAYNHADGVGQEVCAKLAANEIVLMIRNNSGQFGTHPRTTRIGLGLRGIQYRVEFLKGTLTIRSSASGQTELVVVLPLTTSNDPTS